MNRPLHRLLAAATLSTLTTVGSAAFAKGAKPQSQDARIEALEQRLLLLEQRLAESEARNAQLAAASAPSKIEPTPAAKQLDQKVAVIQRKLEASQEAAALAKKTTPKLEVGPEGVSSEHLISLPR